MATGPTLDTCSSKNFTLKTLESLGDLRIGTTDQESPRKHESFMLRSWLEQPILLDPTVWFSSATRKYPENENHEKPDDEMETTEFRGNCYDGADLQMIQEARRRHGDLMGIGAWSNESS